MTDLVERYVHQVGRYLPPKERAEIEAELRSQIQDQLEDRYAASPSPEEVASVLAEFGHPYKMAASYSSEKYLVGPALYPYLMLVLRYVLLLVPATVVFLNLFGALISPPQSSVFGWLIETVIAVVQATLMFSAVVVLFFAAIQHSYLKIDEKEVVFNPLDLPKVDDPFVVDRFEAVAGVALGTIFLLIFVYFLSVGGLTLRFNLNDPGTVIPVPIHWLILLILTVASEIIMHLLVLRRKRWNVALWTVETVLEVFGGVCLYFVLFKPIFERMVADNPSLIDLPVIGSVPEIIAVGFALITLLSRGGRLVRLLTYANDSASSVPVKIAE
jgi:hypothetical protein